MAEAFASSKGRYGYRRIMAEDGLTAHVPRRLYLVKSAWGVEVVTFSWTSRPGGKPPYGEVRQGAA